MLMEHCGATAEQWHVINTSTDISTVVTQRQPGQIAGCEIQNPEQVITAQQKKDFKMNVLRANPETLVADLSKKNNQKVKCNLVFFTQHPENWHTAICEQFTHIKKNGISKGRQITAYEDADRSSPILTIIIYHNETVMIQGSENSLDNFDNSFQTLKTVAASKVSPPPLPLPPQELQTRSPISSRPPPTPYSESTKFSSNLRVLKEGISVLEESS